MSEPQNPSFKAQIEVQSLKMTKDWYKLTFLTNLFREERRPKVKAFLPLREILEAARSI